MHHNKFAIIIRLYINLRVSKYSIGEQKTVVRSFFFFLKVVLLKKERNSSRMKSPRRSPRHISRAIARNRIHNNIIFFSLYYLYCLARFHFERGGFVFAMTTAENTPACTEFSRLSLCCHRCEMPARIYSKFA